MNAATMIRLKTRSGLELDARPATPDDEPALTALFDEVSDEDRRFRFLSASRHVSHEQLAPLVEADHQTSESYLAFDAETGLLVASGLFACDAEMDTAEVAVSVRRDYRAKGVGWALLDLLAEEAARRGARRVISIESRENHAAIELEREKGFVPEPCEDDPGVVILARTFR